MSFSRLCCRTHGNMQSQGRTKANLKQSKIPECKKEILGYFPAIKWKIRMGLEDSLSFDSVFLSELQARGAHFIVQTSFSIAHFIILHSVFP